MSEVLEKRTSKQAKAIRNGLNFMLSAKKKHFSMCSDIEIIDIKINHEANRCNTVCCIAGSIVVANLTDEELAIWFRKGGIQPLTEAATMIGVDKVLAKELFLPCNEWACWHAQKKNAKDFVTPIKAVQVFWFFYKLGFITWNPKELAEYELKYPTPALHTKCDYQPNVT